MIKGTRPIPEEGREWQKQAGEPKLRKRLRDGHTAGANLVVGSSPHRGRLNASLIPSQTASLRSLSCRVISHAESNTCSLGRLLFIETSLQGQFQTVRTPVLILCRCFVTQKITQSASVQGSLLHKNLKLIGACH